MSLANYLPASVRYQLRDLRHGIKALRKSLENSRNAFRPTEYGYRIVLRNAGGYEVAVREATADELVLTDSFENDEFFRAMPDYAPADDDVIVDIGAHIGTFALLAASKIPRGRVIAIEASEETFNLLRINLALNKISNVLPLHLAVCDRRGQATLHHDLGNWGNTIMKRMSSRGELVSTDTLAHVLDAQRVDRCDLIKFNCEGAEFPILMTTPLAVLQRIRRMLVLYHCDIARGFSLEALCGRLREAGFEYEQKNATLSRGWLIARRDERTRS